MAQKVTMQEIADLIGVSKNSVSQALTGKSGVSEHTRMKIVEAARKLGYRHKSIYPGDDSRKGSIGLVASEKVCSENIFYGAIQLSLDKEIKLKQYDFLVHAVDENSEAQHIMPTFITERKVDGVIILSKLSDSYLNKLLAYQIPSVLIDHHSPNVAVDCVLTNNRYGAYGAVEKFVRQGHNEIGFIGNIHYAPSYLERWEGYERAMREHGLTIHHAYTLQNGVESESVLMDWVNSLEKLPTAWFCANDMIAFLLNKCLQKKGIQVPEDVSICGFDNHLLSEMSSPPISTMAINKEYFGRRAVEQLMFRIKQHDAPFEQVMLPVEWIERGSIQTKKGEVELKI